MNDRYSNTISFLDLLFAMVFLFFIMFAVAFVKKSQEDKNIESKAEFVVTVRWPKEVKDDIDTYVEYNSQYLSFFSQPESGPLHLERDDLGYRNDTIQTASGSVKFRQNIEHTYIRTAPSGWYIVNVHAYNKLSDSPTPVTVKVEKMNPYGVVFMKQVSLETRGQEKTICRFRVNEDTEVVEITQEPKSFTQGGIPR